MYNDGTIEKPKNFAIRNDAEQTIATVAIPPTIETPPTLLNILKSRLVPIIKRRRDIPIPAKDSR